MNNNSRSFESKSAFWTLVCIIVSLAVLSAANYYVDFYSKSDEVDSGGEQESHKTYNQAAEVYKYEVIAENGTVNVYSVDSSGQRAFFCETNIPYALLSENDKKMMKKGIMLNTMEELNNILQDFES